tara:strand:+ start:1085 stop:1360 length:276 start_codon:yes stop_codon:yes gene_type:complete
MEAPKLPTIFKNQGSRGFDYQPMYYDAEKERRDELVRRFEGKDAERTKESFRTKMASDWGSRRGGQIGNSNYRVLAIVAGLLIITYFILLN